MKKSKKKKEQIETKNNYTVYKHTSPDGKVYIGSTSLNPKYRWNHGKGYKRCTRFFKAINEIGWDNFEHEILFENLSQSEAEKIEEEYIKKYKSTDEKFGFNMADGASLIGYKRTEETKQKISEAQKGRKMKPESIKKRSEKVKANGTFSGKNNGMYGRHHTKETIEKISKANKGKSNGSLTELHKLRISQSRLNSEKIKRRKVICVETGIVYSSLNETARQFKVTPQAIWASCKGKQCGPIKGHNFKYYKEN